MSARSAHSSGRNLYRSPVVPFGARTLAGLQFDNDHFSPNICFSELASAHNKNFVDVLNSLHANWSRAILRGSWALVGTLPPIACCKDCSAKAACSEEMPNGSNCVTPANWCPDMRQTKLNTLDKSVGYHKSVGLEPICAWSSHNWSTRNRWI